MALSKRLSFCVILILVFTHYNCAHCQLWRYINDTPKGEEEYDKYIEKEACSVVTKSAVVYGDTVSYEITTYPLQSFDGEPYQISISEIPFTRRFIIQIPNDSLIIVDLSGLARVHVFSKDLLEIVYSPRGGSDQGYDNVLLLSINKGKFCIVMEVQSVNEYSIPDEYGLYEKHIKLLGQDRDSYQLLVNTRDLLRAKVKAKNFTHYNKFTLKFDKKQNIFFNRHKYVNGLINVNSKEKRIKGNYPVIDFGEDEYYYIRHMWYERGKNMFSGKDSMNSYCESLARYNLQQQ